MKSLSDEMLANFFARVDAGELVVLPTEHTETEVARLRCQLWENEQRCCVCGKSAKDEIPERGFFFNWGPFRRHYCIDCARDADLEPDPREPFFDL